MVPLVFVSSVNFLCFSIVEILGYSVIGILAIAGNLKVAHWIIRVLTKEMEKRDRIGC